MKTFKEFDSDLQDSLYECLSTCNEGILKDMFPKVHNTLSSLTNKKGYMAAVADWLKIVDDGKKSNQFNLDKVARKYKGVDRKQLATIVNGLVKNKQIDKKYSLEV